MSGTIRQGGFRLSPNEEAAVLKEERDRRRKLRLKQVREQDRLFAKQLLAKSKAKKEAEVKALSVKLEEEWNAVQTEKKQALKEIYEQCLSKVGDGHREAKNQKPMEQERAAEALRNTRAAKQRHQTAILKEGIERNEKWQKENAHIISRKNALEVEKVRASHIANLPPPRNPLADLDLQKPPVMVTRVEGFSTTHYHIPAEYVERAGPHEQDDARLAAKEEDDRMRQETERLQAELRERKEKAVLRHHHAKDKELLKQDYERLLLELSDLQNADRRRRQAVVADIPRQVFQPPHRRLEDKAEKQHQLEEAFEDMYMKHTDYAGDITLALEPKVPGQDTDLDLTADTTKDREEEDQDQEVTLERPGLGGQDPSAQYPGGREEAMQRLRPDSVAGQKPVSARAEMLKRLMGRVRGQQDDWKKQQTKAPTEVATGHPGVIPGTHVQEEDITSPSGSGETESHFSIEMTPTQPVTTAPSELSEYPIESMDNGSTVTSMPRSLETGTLSEVSSEAGSTLLHPMERAARLRGDQLAQQARTQEDIRAIGAEQQKRLQDLQQAVYVPWDDIGLSKPPSVPPYQVQRQMESTEQTVHSGSGFMSEGISGVQASILDPGGSGQAILSNENSQSEAPGTVEGVALGQTQRLADQPQYEAHVPRPQTLPSHLRRVSDGQPTSTDDTDGQLLMRHRPIVVEETTSDLNPSSESDIGNEHAIDRQLLDEVVHDVPEMTQHTLGDGSSIDWLQRAREYQERLLDRQRQSQDSLVQAQLKLQERRQRLMKNYPDVKLPDYMPYTMQSEMGRTGWQTTRQLVDSLTPAVDEAQGVRTLHIESEGNRYDPRISFEPGNSRGRQTLDAYRSPSISSEDALEQSSHSHQLEYEETHVGSSRVSPSKRKLDFFQEADHGARDSRFAPMAEEAISQTSTEESVNLRLERTSDTENVTPYAQQHSVPQVWKERTDRVSHLQERSSHEAETALKIRHEQLLEEKRVLEERQNAQQLRLIQKQQELTNQIEQQQRRYQERMAAANISPPSLLHHKEPPAEHSPSIPQGILRGRGVGSQSPEMESSTGKSTGVDFGGSLSQQMDMRRMMQGQVFRPQDILRHLQASQTIGSEPEDESDASLQSSETLGGTQEAGNMMMGVFKPHELLPHLQTHFTDSDGSLTQDNGSLASSGLLHEQSLRETGTAEQGTRSFDGESSQFTYQQSSVLSEGTLDMESIGSPSLKDTGFGRDRLRGQVFRPADLMAELRAINQEVEKQGSFGSSSEMIQSQTGMPTFESGTLSGSNRLGTGSGPYPSLGSQTASSGLSTGLSYQGSYGTGELSSASDGTKRVYRELLQGHVFRPEDLLPHLQDASSLSNTLDGSSIPEPHLSSTLAYADPYSRSFAQRHEGDGGGSDQLQQTFRGLSLIRDDDLIQAASPDLGDHEAIPHDQPPVPTFLPMIAPTHPAPGSNLMRSRRPPPANIQQVAMLPQTMGPHELSTILETETSADERMHMHGMGATPRNMMPLSQPSSMNERAVDPHFLSGTEGNLGERLPTFGGPATVRDTFHGNQRMHLKRSDDERSQGTLPGMHRQQDNGNSALSVIQISRPTVASHALDEADLYHSAPGLRTPRKTSDLQAVDLSVVASTLSEHTLDDESVANVSSVDYPMPHTEGLKKPSIGEPFGSYGVRTHLGLLGVHRGEPAGESMRWKDLLKSSDDSVTSSNSDGVERSERASMDQPVPAGSEADEFLPMVETENTLMTTQDSMQDYSQDAADGTSTQSHAHFVQTGAMQMQKHLAAGLILDSSNSSDGLTNVHTPRISSQEWSTSTSSSSKLSTIIGAVAGGVSSGPFTDEDDQATDLKVDDSGSGFPTDPDIGIAASQEEYIRDMLTSLQYGRQRGITMPLFSDVSLSGYSMSQDGSTSEIRSPVKGREWTSLEPMLNTSARLKLPGASYPEDQTFPSLSDLQMETGIMEEPDLTFASSLNTTADSMIQAPGLSAAHGRELPEPAPFDVSVSSQTSISMSLLSFQQHEQELLDSSPQATTRVTRSEGQLKVNQSTSSSTSLVRGTRSEGQVKDMQQSASPGQSPTAKLSEAHARELDGAAGGPVSLQEAFQQRKKAFIKASETRKKEVKDHAETRSQEPTAFAKTIQDWKRSKVKVQKKQAPVKKASRSKPDPPLIGSASGLSSALVTPTDRNASQKETKERTQRLYNQLEEVKRQKAEQERQDSYAANRQKKKEFEQKLQAKRLKRTSSLEKTKKKDK